MNHDSLVLGHVRGGVLEIDLPRLLNARLLACANSGAGKSWALRRLLEVTHGHVQQIVLDVEDEFHTLREKGDYVLAGRASGGDCPADPRSAALLARRLLELGVSAVISLYELREDDRHRFVDLFLKSLMSAPRELWHPVMVVIDEAHKFCPEKGQGASLASESVIDLMTRGRKRGFCGVLATQRISKIHKNAAAEANCKLLGRAALDVDMKRVAEELGLSGKAEAHALRLMDPGTFWAFGPGLSDSVVKVRIGDVATTHPKPGERVVAVPPAPAKVRAILSKLADLPEEVKAEEFTSQALHAEVSNLRRELAERNREIGTLRAQPPGFSAAERDRAGEAVKLISKGYDVLLPLLRDVFGRAELAASVRADPVYPLTPASSVSNYVEGKAIRRLSHSSSPEAGHGSETSVPRGASGAHTVLLPPLWKFGQLTRDELAILSGIARGGTFDKYLSTCRSQMLIGDAPDGRLWITDAGVKANDRRLPLTRSLRVMHWIRKCGPARSLLTALVEAGQQLTRDELASASGFARGGTFDKYLSTVKGLGVAVVDRNVVSVAPALLREERD